MNPPGAAHVTAAPAANRSRLLDALVESLAPERLDAAVPPALWERALRGPLCEFARRPGKELRSRLTEVAWTLAGGGGYVPPSLPLVVEGLHAGSLIVDDVQDAADERRGAPALHLLYGPALAINTGNWLYFWALAQLDAPELRQLPLATRAAMQRSTVATLLACHQGQALDLTARASELDPARASSVVAAITRGKTAALMGLGPRLAALAAGASEPIAALLGRLGEDLGTGLQMLDDLGGLGRGRRAKGVEDLRGDRATWPWAWAAERLDQLSYLRLQHRTRAAAERPDLRDGDEELAAVAETLRGEVEELGRAQAHAVIRAAVVRTGELLGAHPAFAALVHDVGRLEESYG